MELAEKFAPTQKGYCGGLLQSCPACSSILLCSFLRPPFLKTFHDMRKMGRAETPMEGVSPCRSLKLIIL